MKLRKHLYNIIIYIIRQNIINPRRHGMNIVSSKMKLLKKLTKPMKAIKITCLIVKLILITKNLEIHQEAAKGSYWSSITYC